MRFSELQKAVDCLASGLDYDGFYIGELRNGKKCLVYDDGKRFQVVPLTAYGTKYAKKELNMLIPTIVMIDMNN